MQKGRKKVEYEFRPRPSSRDGPSRIVRGSTQPLHAVSSLKARLERAEHMLEDARQKEALQKMEISHLQEGVNVALDLAHTNFASFDSDAISSLTASIAQGSLPHTQRVSKSGSGLPRTRESKQKLDDYLGDALSPLGRTEQYDDDSPRIVDEDALADTARRSNTRGSGGNLDLSSSTQSLPDVRPGSSEGNPSSGARSSGSFRQTMAAQRRMNASQSTSSLGRTKRLKAPRPGRAQAR